MAWRSIKKGGYMNLTEEQEIARGRMLAELLRLKPIKGEGWSVDRYDTTWGTKTALGLFRTVAAVVNEGKGV